MKETNRMTDIKKEEHKEERIKERTHTSLEGQKEGRTTSRQWDDFSNLGIQIYFLLHFSILT